MSLLLATASTTATTVAASASTAKPVSIFSLMLQLLVGLAVVLGLIWVASRVMRGRMGGVGTSRRRHGLVNVVGRQSLGKGVQLAVVRAGTETYLLGVTAHQVTRLARYQPDLMEELEALEAEQTAGGPAVRRSGSSFLTGLLGAAKSSRARDGLPRPALSPLTGLFSRRVRPDAPVTLGDYSQPHPGGAQPVPVRLQSAIRQLQDRTVRRA